MGREIPQCLRLKYLRYLENLKTKERNMPNGVYTVHSPDIFCPLGACEFSLLIIETVKDGELDGVFIDTKGACLSEN